MGTYDPFDMILKERLDDAEARHEPLADAISELRTSASMARIVPILRSSNARVVTNGLFVLSEAGALPPTIIDLALNHARHPEWNARFYLADSLLVSNNNLSSSQLGRALSLVEDENPDVRCKMMEFVAVAHHKLTESTIKKATELRRKSEHLAGLELLHNLNISNDSLIEVVSAKGFVVRCYAGARILLNAKLGMLGANFPSEKNAELDYLNWRLELR